MHNENELFICDCDDLSHQLVVELFDTGSDNKTAPDEQVNLVFSLYFQKANVFKRFWRAGKYLLGFQSAFSSLTFRFEDTERLIKTLVNYRKRHKQRVMVGAARQTDFVRVPLDKIPAFYGYKFLFADVRPPLATVHYAVNGELVEMGLRVDLGKAVFFDQITDQTLLRAVNSARNEIFKTILDGIKKE